MSKQLPPTQEKTDSSAMRHPTLNRILAKEQPAAAGRPEAEPDDERTQPPKQEHIDKLKQAARFEKESAPVLAAERLGLKPLYSALLATMCEHNEAPNKESFETMIRYIEKIAEFHPPMSSPYQPAEQ